MLAHLDWSLVVKHLVAVGLRLGCSHVLNVAAVDVESAYWILTVARSIDV